MEHNINAVLEQRSRYGDFRDIAKFCEVVNAHINHLLENDTVMRHTSLQASRMIVHKLARAIYGDWSYDDNWVDIIGYSTLAINCCEISTTVEDELFNDEIPHMIETLKPLMKTNLSEQQLKDAIQILTQVYKLTTVDLANHIKYFERISAIAKSNL